VRLGVVVAGLSAFTCMSPSPAASAGRCTPAVGDQVISVGQVTAWYPMTVDPDANAPVYGCSTRVGRVVLLGSFATPCPGSGMECSGSDVSVDILRSTGDWAAFVVSISGNAEQRLIGLGNLRTGKGPSSGLVDISFEDGLVSALLVRRDGAVAWLMDTGELQACGRKCRTQQADPRTLDSSADSGSVRFGRHDQLFWLHNGHRRKTRLI
jgi:hypothetical protein